MRNYLGIIFTLDRAIVSRVAAIRKIIRTPRCSREAKRLSSIWNSRGVSACELKGIIIERSV